MSADVSVLLVTYGHEDEIGPCLDAVLDQAGAGLELEVLVVDNASPDGTVARVRSYGERVRLIELSENIGYAAGVNAAFRESSGVTALLLNPDVVMDPGCLRALHAYLESRSDVVAVSALLRNLDGSPQLFARREIGVGGAILSFTRYGRWLDRRLLGGRASRRRRYEDEWPLLAEGPIAVDCPAAACVLLGRKAADSGLLREDLPLFFNDAELYRRLRRSGRIEVLPEAGAAHGYGTSILQVDPARMRAEWVVATRRYLRSEVGPVRRAALWLAFLADAALGALAHLVGRGDAATPAEVRGTLGGLGLPGGASPWLSDVPSWR